MRIPTDRLTRKALLALEEVLTKLPDDAPGDSSFAVKACLAYLFAVSDGKRSSFDDFWTEVRVAPKDYFWAVVRSQHANAHLNEIYRAVGVCRTGDMMFFTFQQRELKEEREKARTNV